MIGELAKRVPSEYIGYVAMAFWVLHYVSLTWLHFNLAKRYDPSKSDQVPKSFFVIGPARQIEIFGFLFFAPRQLVGSDKAFGYVRLARFSIVLFFLLAGLALAIHTANRPPRDGQVAFVRSPDGISVELLQKGPALPPMEPWASMANTGSW